MSDTDIEQLRDWIIQEGLKEFKFEQIFQTVCETLAPQFKLYRVSIGMATLHPLVEARMLRWYRGTGLEFFESEHGYSSQDDWLSSPISHMFNNLLKELRYRLDKPGDWQRFPVLVELADSGCTEYYARVVSFDNDPNPSSENPDGVLAIWATDDPNGFSDEFFSTLDQVLPCLGLVSKLEDRESTLINILEAYFGQDAGMRVASGQIERGELVSIDAIIWYSDMRDSTYLADSLTNQEFLDTLNAYFECTAGSILENSGEVLRFIGDAVLAIFPVENFGTATNAAESAWQAAIDARTKINKLNPERKAANLHPLDFGLGLHAGILDYGNIGTPTRLEFSVIGPVANEVARLESLTKDFNRPVIVSESFSKLLDLNWEHLGTPKLKGVNKDFSIYSISL